MIILVSKDSSLQEHFNGILSFYINSIVAEISLYISYNIKSLRSKKVDVPLIQYVNTVLSCICSTHNVAIYLRNSVSFIL